MTTEHLRWIMLTGSAFAAGLTVWSVANALTALARVGGHGLFARRRALWRQLDWLRQAETPTPLTEEEILGLAPVNWTLWRLGAAAVGVAALALLVGGSDYVWLAPAGGLAYFLPGVARNLRLDTARWRLRLEVRDFIGALRLALALNVTLSRALAEWAERGRDTEIVSRALRRAQGTLATVGPAQMLARLAEDLRSTDLRDLLARVAAAQRGGLTFAEALSASAQQISEDLALDAEYAVEAAPNELILPMLFALFPPILLLALLPVVDTLLNAMSVTR